MKKRLLLWIGLAVSLVLLWLTLRDVDFARLGGQLARANYGWLIPALACHLLFVAARSERWRVLMGRDRVQFGDAFWVTSIGYLISNVVPLRIGDAARAVLVDRRCHIGIPRAFSTVVVERILDMLTILLELALLIPFMRLPPQALGWVRLFGALSLAAVLVIAVLLTQRRWTERMLAAALARLPGVAPEPWMGRWRNLISGFDALSSPRSVLIVAGWSLVTWAAMTGIFWAILQAFFPGASPVPAAFLVCAEAFGWVVPASPGNWGVFDKIAREALVGPFGYPLEPSVGYALVTHFFSYVVANILGVMGLMRYSLSLGEISAEALKATASGEDK